MLFPKGHAKQSTHSYSWKTQELIIIYYFLTNFSSKNNNLLLAMSPTDMLRIKEFNYLCDQALASVR